MEVAVALITASWSALERVVEVSPAKVRFEEKTSEGKDAVVGADDGRGVGKRVGG